MMLHTSQDPCYYFGSSGCEPAGAETSSGLPRARKLTQNAQKVAKSGTPEAPGTPLGAAKSDPKCEKYGVLRAPPKLQNGHQKSKLLPKDDFSEPQEATMRPQTVPAKSCPKKRLPCADIRLLQSELKKRLNLHLTPAGYPWQHPKVRDS